MKLLRKITGYRHKYSNLIHGFNWGEVSFLNYKLGITISDVSDYTCVNVHLIFVCLYIKLPFIKLERDRRLHRHSMYGVYIYPDVLKWEDISFCWKFKRGRISMPWTYKFEKEEILDWKFKSVYERGPFDKCHVKYVVLWYRVKEEIMDDVSQEFDYTYTTVNGDVQKRKVRVNVERLTWCMRGCPWIKRAHTTINVRFDTEIGDAVGTWKGGCLACSYRMLPGETPYQTLRRMEQERKFT